MRNNTGRLLKFYLPRECAIRVFFSLEAITQWMIVTNWIFINIKNLIKTTDNNNCKITDLEFGYNW